MTTVMAPCACEQMLGARCWTSSFVAPCAATLWRLPATLWRPVAERSTTPCAQRRRWQCPIAALAIMWHNADASIRSNPAFVSTLIGEWSSLAPQLPIGLLMFLDLPDPVATTEQTTAAVLRGQPGPDPDRANLKDAPDGAWWQPKPGELTQ